MSQDEEAAETSPPTESVEVCHRKVPKSVMIQIFQCLDKASLKIASEVSKSFNELSKHPSLKISTNYTGYFRIKRLFHIWSAAPSSCC